jgi:hypothetical protein
MGSVSWRWGKRLIITATWVYAQRWQADGRCCVGIICMKDVTGVDLKTVKRLLERGGITPRSNPAGPAAAGPAPRQGRPPASVLQAVAAPVGATVFSTPHIPDRMQRLAGPYRWQASSHPDLCSRQCRHGCASSLWEQLSFLLRTCPIARGAWQGPIAGKPAPTQTSVALNVGMAAQAACGSNCLFYSVHARSHAAPGRALSLASQLPPRPL